MDERWDTLLRAFSRFWVNLMGVLGWAVLLVKVLRIALTPLFPVWQSSGQLCAQQERAEVLSKSLG